MIFKRREDAARDDYVGEARYVDPSEAITEVSDHTIDAVAEPQIVSPVATIGPSIVIKGEVTGDEDLLVEGRVEGNVSLPKSRLSIGHNGDISADVHAKVLNIEGSIHGDVDAGETVVLKSGGNMHGNIKAPRITLEDGCIFNGTISMEPEATATVTDFKSTAQAEPAIKTTGEQQVV